MQKYDPKIKLSLTELEQAFKELNGKYSIEKIKYQRFKADKDENRTHKADKTYEYLHILIKG